MRTHRKIRHAGAFGLGMPPTKTGVCDSFGEGGMGERMRHHAAGGGGRPPMRSSCEGAKTELARVDSSIAPRTGKNRLEHALP
ncbi:MAG: hypothetical protein WBE26_20000, partial [Phycisphaerae bacterium]